MIMKYGPINNLHFHLHLDLPEWYDQNPLVSPKMEPNTVPF